MATMKLKQMPSTEERIEQMRMREEEIKEDQRALRKIDPQEIAHKINDAGMQSVLSETLLKLREAKPDERSERSRRYAVTITEMEKVVAYFKTFVIDDVKAERHE